MNAEPSIEEMKAQLIAAGWKAQTATIWASPAKKLFLGPYGAWKVMKRIGNMPERKTDRGWNFCDDIAKILLEGLTTDGAHHKQWYLAQALRVLAGDEFVDKAKQDFGFKEGRAA